MSRTMPSGSGSRNDGHSSGGGTTGATASVNWKPSRGAPNTASVVWPASAPGVRAVALSCEIERPRRSTVTSMSTGPACTCAANTVVTLRNVWSGSPSSAVIARTVVAVTRPPWGTTGQFHSSPMKARYAPSPVARRSTAVPSLEHRPGHGSMMAETVANPRSRI